MQFQFMCVEVRYYVEFSMFQVFVLLSGQKVEVVPKRNV